MVSVNLADYEPGLWAKEPRRSESILLYPERRFYLDNKEVTEEEFNTVSRAQRAADEEARKQKEFSGAEDAFVYADTLQDGVVLDWGSSYAAMEREGLKIGFCIEPYDQPVVTRRDLLTRPGPNFILARRIEDRGCCTCFSDESQSYSDSVYEVIEDGTGRYSKGQRLQTRVVPNEGARVSVGRNWRMKLLKPGDVQMVLPLLTGTEKINEN